MSCSMRILKVAITTALLAMGGNAVADCKLILGWDAWEPYIYEAGKDVTGLDGDLAKALAREAGCELSFVKLPWKRLLEDIKDGAVHFTTGASISEERQTYANFSNPYRDESNVLLVRAADVEKYKLTKFEDMVGSGFNLGVVREYFYGDAFKAAMENPVFARQVSDVTADVQNFKKLEGGRIDGLLADRYTVADQIRKNNLQGKFATHPMPVSSEVVHLIFSKKSVPVETVQKFNAALETLRKNGTYDQIVSRYLQ